MSSNGFDLIKVSGIDALHNPLGPQFSKVRLRPRPSKTAWTIFWGSCWIPDGLSRSKEVVQKVVPKATGKALDLCSTGPIPSASEGPTKGLPSPSEREGISVVCGQSHQASFCVPPGINYVHQRG